MRHHSARWLILRGTLGLIILILAACGSGGTGGTVSSTPTPSTPSAATSPASTPPASSSYPPFTNIIKFVASGGLSGPYTITEIDNGPTNSEFLQSARLLQIGVSDS